MWGWWIVAASAGEVTLDEVSDQGLPRQHTALAACDCVEMQWIDEDGNESLVRLPHAQILAVRHDAVDGVHHLGLRLADDRLVWLEEAPCPIVRPMADTYAGAFGLPVEGTGIDVQCVDVVAEALAYRARQARRMQPVSRWETPMATVVATSSKAEGLDELEGAFSTARPLLGACFATGGVAEERHVLLTAVVAPGGAWKKLELVEEIDPVATCVLNNVQATTPSEVRKKTKVSLDVGFVPPVSP